MQRLCALVLSITLVPISFAATKPKWSKATEKLMKADEAGDEDDILAALAAGADANARDEDKNTPLILTAPQSLFGKDRKIVEAFVKAKAKVDAANKDGVTAMMSAAASDAKA